MSRPGHARQRKIEPNCGSTSQRAIRDGVLKFVVRQCTCRGGQSRGISDFTEPGPVLLSPRVMTASTYLDCLTHTNAVTTELAIISAQTRTAPPATPPGYGLRDRRAPSFFCR